MAKNLVQLKTMQASTAQQVKDLNDKYENQLADPTVSMQDRKDTKANLDDMNDRLTEITNKVSAAQKELEDKFTPNNNLTPAQTGDQKVIKGYANIMRDVFRNGKTVDINAFKNETSVQGVGEKSGDSFLPITVSNDLISEPQNPNPLRDDATFTSLVNLRVPRADVTFGDAFATILDGEAAKEATLKGDQITFGRHESKVRIGLTDTLLSGSDLALVQYAQSRLENGASDLELARAFATTPVAGEEHMSLYDASNDVKKISGTDMFDTISDALDDLSDADRNLAKIYMTRAQFGKIKKTLANNSATLWGATPESILGAPVEFTAFVKSPVVGNFSQYQGNYDPQGSIIEQYRKPETGTTYVQITLWYDAQVRRSSAFRIVSVNP